MCDERTVDEANQYLNHRGDLSRRQFGKLSVGTGLAMLLPQVVNAQAVTETRVQVRTPDGEADCYFVYPADGPSPGVLVWPDALGLRPAFEQMGRRLAESGYAVLVVNPYYRSATAPVVPEGASFQNPETRNILVGLMGSLNAETHVADATAFVGFLDAQAAVDSNRKIGTTGYCMGGPITMRTAAALPDRIGAAGSFHGGGLVSDASDSPHLLVPRMQASYLFAIADNDDMADPEAKNTLRQAFDDAGLDAEIEVYAGAQHGWCPLDSAVYNEAQAERAWSRLLVLFENALV
jgi:carboxymethylenebutenolidase